jgi:hypothetical protein
MLLIYTPRITNRLRYITGLMLRDLLGLELVFTSREDEYLSCEGPKLCYGKCLATGELFIASSGLLFETGISGKEMHYFDFGDSKAFFLVYDTTSLFPFDIFSASFFLVSRYEEYLPHFRDIHGRFPAQESEAFKQGFLRRPLVNIWTVAIKEALAARYPAIVFRKRTFRFQPTYDIDAAYAYSHKGFTRTLGGFLKTIQAGNFKEMKQRLRVLLNLENDPFDTFALQFKWQKQYDLHPVYFILFADYGLNDKNLPVNDRYFQALIKAIADHAEVGIHPSYGSNQKPAKLATEIARLSKVLRREITSSRQHFLKIELPATYRNLINLDITDDYSMGFASEPGFRAGICDTFNFYNLDLETETKLRVHPFAIMDATLIDYLGMKPEHAYTYIEPLLREVRSLGGTFISLWHNHALSNDGQYKGWVSVYEDLLKNATS